MEQFKANGETTKTLMELAINEIRENRNEIKDVKVKMFEGAGKIAANRESISKLWWVAGTVITLIMAVLGWTIFGG